MIVSELIELLEKCDQRFEVYIENPDRTQDYFVDKILIDNCAAFIQTSE